MNEKLNYRSDIDGLRAIAVLAVLFYHAGSKAFSGGYVGVDVFFVISGYLITGIIFREIQAHEFSLKKFYERRIRRIFPALFVLLAVTVVTSAFLYDTEAFSAFSKSVTSTTLFYSNILFWKEAGYFEGPSTLKPLLHTWSLAVEEQFYIFFPLILIALAELLKSKNRIFAGLVFIALVSFAGSIYGMNTDPSGAFYLAHLRAWELIIGGLLALNVIPNPKNGLLRNGLSVAGIGMIIASVFLYTEETAFPGVSALLPTLGSTLIIYSGIDGESLGGRILGLRPAVFIGQISYSLYLWHWPIIVFWKYYIIRQPNTTDETIWVIASLALAVLSWKFIEKPFRSKTFLEKSKIFVFAGSVMALSLAATSSIYFYDGFPQRFSSQEAATKNKWDFEWPRWAECSVERAKTPPTEIKLCESGAKGRKPTFLLWGDSHARAIASAVDKSAKATNMAGYITSMPGCQPLLGIDRPGPLKGSCYAYNNMVIAYIQEHKELDTIILSGRWVIASNGQRYKTEGGEPVKLIDLSENRERKNLALFRIGIKRTVEKLLKLNRKVVIVAVIPEIGYNVPSAYAIASRTGRNINEIIAPTWAEYQDRSRETTRILDSLKSEQALVVYPSEILCNKDMCKVVLDGKPLYRDDDHLSTFGAWYISSIFAPVFKQAHDIPGK